MTEEVYTKDEDKESFKTFNKTKDERGKIIFSNIGVDDGHGNIIPLDYCKEDLLYLTYYDTKTGSVRTDCCGKFNPLYLYDILDDKKFNKWKKDYSGKYVGFSRFLSAVEKGIDEPMCLDIEVNYDYYFRYDEQTKPTVPDRISIDDFIQNTIITLNYDRQKLINRLYVCEKGKWIPFRNIVNKLDMLGVDSNCPPMCIIKEFVVDGVRLRSITTLDIHNLDVEEKFNASDVKFLFITKIVVAKLKRL